MLIRRIARPMLATTFIARGVEALRSPKSAADAARPTLEGLSKMPDPIGPNVPTNAETVARVTAGVQIGAGLLLASGRLPRISSAALALSVVPGSLGGHAFWKEPDPERKAAERRALLTDVGLIGGLIIASVDTEGKPSLGWRGRRAARKVSEAVTSALPAGSSSSTALVDTALVEKVGHGLAVGAERGRGLAEVAVERGSELAAEVADVARERGPELAKFARKRGAELADLAREREHELADLARERGPELAKFARKRGAELADLAREREHELADLARERSAQLADVARERGPELADLARERSAELAELAQDRGSELTTAARKQAKKQRRSR